MRGDTIDQLQKAEAERDRLAEALRWYGDRANWSHASAVNSKIDRDGGERARAALEGQPAAAAPKKPTVLGYLAELTDNRVTTPPTDDAKAAEVERSLRAIVEFCDDPDGSEKPETLAQGLARLLPDARAALAGAPPPAPESGQLLTAAKALLAHLGPQRRMSTERQLLAYDVSAAITTTEHAGRPLVTAGLLDAAKLAFEWLTTHGVHPPYCERKKARIIADAHSTGLSKDYGGRYLTTDERSKLPCTCGLDELHTALCMAAVEASPSPVGELVETLAALLEQYLPAGYYPDYVSELGPKHPATRARALIAEHRPADKPGEATP